jgi:hypothetical protein
LTRHENATIKFLDWIAVRFGMDQIAQHKSQPEDCGKAIELAIETIEAK